MATTSTAAAFQTLCREYEDVLDEAAEPTRAVDERIGLALFKIDEAAAFADTAQRETISSHAALLEALEQHCNALTELYARVDCIADFVGNVQSKAKELERRVDSISKASDPVFRTGTVSTLLRTFSLKPAAADAASRRPAPWEPMDLDLGARQLIARLDAAAADGTASTQTPAAVSDGGSDSAQV